MAVNIGAKIGIEGEAQYRKAVKDIIETTKDLKSEFKELETSFSSNKSIENITKQRENLNKQLQETTKALEKQKDLLNNAQQFNLNQKIGLNWADPGEQISEEKMKSLQRNVQNTEVEVMKLRNQIQALPSDIKVVSDAWKNATSDWGEVLQGVGSFLTKYVTVPLTLAAGGSVKAFADWESAFTGVRKTVEGTPEELEAVAEGITRIALSSASSREEIAGVAEVAGQLGIGVKDIEKFTEVMVMLGDSTNVSAEEAATAIAKIINITEGGVDKYGTENIMRLGNAIVNLGNNYATTEADIIHMSNRLAAGGKLAGLTTQEILGLSTAMTSVGITAEAGGTAMTQTLTAIEKEFAAFTKGTDNNLARIGEIAGMTAEQFADAWKNRPAEAVQAFISGLGALDEKGESATLVLDELGMAGIRQSNMLKSLALASDVMTSAIEDSNKAFAEGNDLFDEAQKRYGTFDTQTKQLGESFKILGSEVGKSIADLLIPVVEGLTKFVTKMAEVWKGLPKPIQQTIIILGGLAAVLGPLLVLGGSFMIFMEKIAAVGTALSGTAWTLGAIGKVIGGVSLVLTGAVTALTSFVDMWKNGWTVVGEIIKDVGIALAAVGAILLGVPAATAAIAAAVIAIVTGLAAYIKNNWDSIVEFTTKFFEAMKEAWNDFTELVSIVVELLAGWIWDKFTEIAESIRTKIEYARELCTQAFENMKSDAITIIERLREGVKQKIDLVKDAIKTGIGIAVEYIKSLPSQALSWGQDLISNFASGITARIGSVINAVSNVASRVRSFLHFSEPDVGPLSDFHTYMPDMMKLMAKGINDNSYLVEDALSNLTGKMSSEVEGNQMTTNYGGVVINLNVPEGANGQMLVDEIEQELANRTMRRKAVFG